MLQFNLLVFTQACEIRHVNLNPYMGVCMELPDVCIVSEHCSKGSLQVKRNGTSFNDTAWRTLGAFFEAAVVRAS